MIASADYNKVQTYEEIKLRYEMSHSCKSRGFQDLLGYVDFKVQSLIAADNHEVLPSPTFSAMSICCLEKAQASDIEEFQAICMSL